MKHGKYGFANLKISVPKRKVFYVLLFTHYPKCVQPDDDELLERMKHAAPLKNCVYSIGKPTHAHF